MSVLTLAIATERFWRLVAKGKDNECWEWVGSYYANGYGQFVSGKVVGLKRAHRFSYYIANGDFDRKLCCCHRCDNKRCVNPKHLWLGTQKENVRDCLRKKRFTIGTKHYKARLNQRKVARIRYAYKNAKLTYAELAKAFGVHPSTINFVIKERTWFHK